MSKSTSAFGGAPPIQELVAEDGTTWAEFRKTLRPDFAMAWRGVAFCYCMLLSAVFLEAEEELHWSVTASLLLAPVFAIWFGFWLHALNQFGHEGAHGHLHPNRRWNDRLSDWLIWPFFAQSVRVYRRRHMQHHVHLGDHKDTEVAYRQCMDPWFLLRLVTGVHLVGLLRRQLLERAPASERVDEHARDTSRRERTLAILRTLAIHGAVVAVPLACGLPAIAAAWVLALFVAYPAFGTIRPLVEHRALGASCAVDYARVEHGPVNRHFGDDFFSRHFGAAGVNKHLLHHWDHTVSYTRFAEMEAFLRRTPHAAALESGRSTYGRAFLALLATARRTAR